MADLSSHDSLTSGRHWPQTTLIRCFIASLISHRPGMLKFRMCSTSCNRMLFYPSDNSSRSVQLDEATQIANGQLLVLCCWVGRVQDDVEPMFAPGRLILHAATITVTCILATSWELCAVLPFQVNVKHEWLYIMDDPGYKSSLQMFFELTVYFHHAWRDGALWIVSQRPRLTAVRFDTTRPLCNLFGTNVLLLFDVIISQVSHVPQY